MQQQAPLLIVDDEPQNLAAMRQVLAPQYPLVFARNGAEALSATAKHRPALVLLDIQMPDMDGYTVCRRLKSDSQSSSTPVIFVTSLSEIGNEAAGFEAGAVDYLVKPVSPSIVLARVRTHLSLVQATQLEKSHRDAIYMLGQAGHFNDTDTGVHIWRMAAYSAMLAATSGWDAPSCHLLEMAAPMHDTGKLGIPDAILRKPGPLTPEEWEVMKTHTRIGHDILIRSEAPIFKLAAEVALRHHEKWDGSGYPDGLAGTAIPESARIVSLADVFDALTMKRPYKDAWPLEKALTTLRDGRGSHFEPRLIEVFDAALPKLLEIKDIWGDRAEQAEHDELMLF
ncbi:two-component system response regulator [Chromobacterium phragmitis]|uniref:Two-component system response regulator n=1 Tax=Chromobacterium phragmitis TaxID=2202141 RepID=A0A344ULP6_9NEIS|nr:HD domain-containing phosphohydrolase [Chromobacterium phragmitis]AXE30816.1 two-component system response regulator [Chromobacterium phragmitis]AXE36194.1 two-component system response regulator [Chromobacterium phragmitis]